MRHLTNNELSAVSAGDFTCTGGTGGFNCTGSTQDWLDLIDSVVNAVKEFISDFFG